MTLEHDRVQDLLAAVALGAAGEGETERVEAHAATCPVCREELDGLRSAAGALALAVSQREPPPQLKDRVMAAVREEPRATPAASPRRRRRPARPRLGGFSWAPVAAGLAVVVLGLLVWNVALNSSSGDSGVTALSVHGGASAPGVRGQVLVLRDHGTAVVRLSHLPAPGAGRRYELWAIRDGAPVSAGFMTPSAGGGAVVATDDLAGVTALAVTPEPEGNTTAPTGPKVVVAPLPAQG